MCYFFIVDDKPIIRRVKPPVKSEAVSPSGTTTVTIVKKDRTEDPQTNTILYSPSTITYNVVATSSSKDSQSSQEKVEVQQQTQDIQQYYNAGVKIIGGEEYITTYQPGEQIIYQATSTPNEEQQIQHQECIQEQHEQQQQECVQHNESKTTLIPIPNISSICADAASPTEASDLYFLIGLLPDFRNLNHDQKRKVKIGILRVLDDAIMIT